MLTSNVEFIEDGHIYLVDGIIVPSVTQIINYLYPDKFKSIPKAILNQKAQFGTNVHKAIELYTKGLEMSLSPIEQISFEQYIKLKKTHDIKPLKQEEIIQYKGLYAGKLDMVASVNGIESLIDIKTTAKIEYEMLEWQLGMYKLGVKSVGGVVEKCYVLWLPKKDLGQLIEITPKTKEEIEEVVYEYHAR